MGPEGFEPTTKGLWVPCATAAPQARDDFLFLFNFQFSKRSGILIYGSLGFASIHLLHFKTCHLGNFCNGVLQARDDFLFLFNFQFALAFGLAVARALSFPSTSKDYQSFSWSPCQQARDDFLFLFNFQFSKRSGILIYGSLGFASIHLLHFKTCHLGNFCNGVLQARDDFLFLFNFQFALAFGLAVARALSFPSTSKDYQSFSWSPCQQARDDFLFLFNFQTFSKQGLFSIIQPALL